MISLSGVVTAVADSSMYVTTVLGSSVVSTGRSVEITESNLVSIDEFTVTGPDAVENDGIFVLQTTINAATVTLTGSTRGGLGTAGVRMDDLSIVANELTVTGTSFANSVGSGSSGIVCIDSSLDSQTSASIEGRGGTLGETGNHGIVFMGLSTLSGGAFTVTGKAVHSTGSHGVYIAPTANLAIDVSSCSFVCAVVNPSSMAGDSDHAFFIDQGFVSISSGVVTVAGTLTMGMEPSDSHACVFTGGSLSVNAAATASFMCFSDNGPQDTNGIAVDNFIFNLLNSLSLTGQGSLLGGDGISWVSSNCVAFGSPEVRLTGSGGLSTKTGNVGVRFTGNPSDFRTSVLTIEGNGGGIGGSIQNTGVLIGASVTAAAVTVTGVAGQTTGASCHGVIVTQGLATTVGNIVLGGRWGPGDESTGVIVFAGPGISSAGTLSILAEPINLSVIPSDPIGICIDGGILSSANSMRITALTSLDTQAGVIFDGAMLTSNTAIEVSGSVGFFPALRQLPLSLTLLRLLRGLPGWSSTCYQQLFQQQTPCLCKEVVSSA